jgi:hypothetical protein
MAETTATPKKEYTKEDFLQIATQKAEETKKVIANDLKFNPDGIREMLKEKPTECTVFFTDLIGQPFDGSDGHITILMEKSISSTDAMASCLAFSYQNFRTAKNKAAGSGRRPGRPAGTSKPVSTEAKEPKLPRKLDFAAMDVPFKPNTKQHMVYSELLAYSGKSKDFKAVVEAKLAAAGLETRNVTALIEGTLTDARKRGKKIEVVDEVYVISTPAPTAA